LNIGPRADGTITDEQKNVLLAIGDWLNVNGESIYGTRCWKNRVKVLQNQPEALSLTIGL